MIKLTEEEYEEIDAIIRSGSEYYDIRFKEAKQKGWIKKTTLEKARELWNNRWGLNNPEDDEFLYKLHRLYEQAIKEIQENK